MAAISMPAWPPPRSIEWDFDENIGEARSDFSWKTQHHDWNQAILRGSVSFAPMDAAEARPWVAFLARCNGKKNDFLFGDPLLMAAPANPSASGGAVVGSGQTGRVLNTSASNMTAGDWIQVGQRLYQVVSPSGGTLQIWPPLRESPADGTAIVLANCRGLFRLSSNARGYSIDERKQYLVTFEIEEAI